MNFGQKTAEQDQQEMDSDLWYKDADVQSQMVKNDAMKTEQQGALIGQGFGASDNITLEDPNDKAIREGLVDDDPFRKTGSAGAGIAGGIAGGLMDIAGLPINLFALTDKDSTPDYFRASGSGNFARGWKATSDWLKGAGSKAEMDYYWHGTIPEGYEEDAEGNLVKKKTSVELNGYEASADSGSGFS
jgi:hypothetical protein